MRKLSLTHTYPKKVMNKGSGFLTGYSHTLNPYTGCSFACSYCYVREMPVQRFRNKDWGTWVDIKTEIAMRVKKEIQNGKKHGPVTIFMASSTDPYQPIEHRERITRSILEVMVEEPPDFLLVQTRSALVTRDIDLLKKLGNRVRVSMTIETDRDEIRRHFAPQAPPIQGRIKALKRLSEEGIPTQAAVAPLLPSSRSFPEQLSDVVDRVCIDDFFMGDGSGGKRTERLNIQDLFFDIQMERWYQKDTIEKVYNRFLQHFSKEQLYLSQDGFLP